MNVSKRSLLILFSTLQSMASMALKNQLDGKESEPFSDD